MFQASLRDLENLKFESNHGTFDATSWQIFFYETIFWVSNIVPRNISHSINSARNFADIEVSSKLVLILDIIHLAFRSEV